MSAQLETVLLVSAKEVAKLLGIGLSTFDRHRAAGLIGPQPVKLGGSIRFHRHELEEWTGAGCPDARAWQAMKATKEHQARLKLRLP